MIRDRITGYIDIYRLLLIKAFIFTLTCVSSVWNSGIHPNRLEHKKKNSNNLLLDVLLFCTLSDDRRIILMLCDYLCTSAPQNRKSL